MRIGEARNLDELVRACEEARVRRLELRRGHETVWWNNIALLAGDHFAEWSPDRAQLLDRVKQEPYKIRLPLNHALTVARTELAKSTKSRPLMDVMAASDEAKDIAGARVGRAFLDHAEWRFHLRKRRKNALWWTFSTGIGAIFTGWDQNNDVEGTIDYVIDPQTGEAVFSPDRTAELEKMVEEGLLDSLKEEKFALGELDYKVYSPFQLLPDEVATDFNEINDLITTDILNMDVAAGIWPGAKNLQPETTYLGTVERRTLVRVGLMPAKDHQVQDAVHIHTFWLLPNIYPQNPLLKNGIMLRWANHSKELEHTKTFPYSDKRIPFAFFQHIPNGVGIWPMSIIEQIRDVNLEMDRMVSKLIENVDYMANPMWVVATQHRIKGKIKNQAGGIVRYVHSPNVPPPQPVPGVPLPTQVENIVVGLRDQILDISGQGEVSRGRVPSGVRSGVQVEYLQEEDETKIAPTTENIEEATALMSSMTLSRAGQFYTTDRLIRIYRNDGTFDVRKFKGANLAGNTDVVPVAGSALPKSKAARKQYVLELIQLGILKDPKKVNDMLELGQGEPDDIDKAMRQADRENQKMLTGGQPQADPSDPEAKSMAIPVKTWHNHEVHLQRHYSIMMDPEFEELETTKPAIVRLFDEHVTMHQKAVEAQQMAQMQMLLAAKGAPDTPQRPGQTGVPNPDEQNQPIPTGGR